MLLTITYRGENATDLGYLLHKNPQRPQRFALGHGQAYVFYPQVEPAVCTACLLLDIDPLDLARGKVGSREGGLFDYINDRPYVSSSFLSTAISKVYGTAMAGRCDQRPQLAERPLALTAALTMLPCRGDTAMLESVFAPLGYRVSFEAYALDERYPEWGDSHYVDLTLTGRVRLQDLLRHLYVLIPVFDRQKHYWMGEEEVEKLLRHGESWLETHPEREWIARRYFSRRQGLARQALDRLEERGDPGEDAAQRPVRPPNLNSRRLEAVVEVLREAGVGSVIDLGCGEGSLLRLLLQQPSFTRIAGMDVSVAALQRAHRRLRLDRLPEGARGRITLFQGSLTYRDERCAGYDAAAVVEVIEHLDPSRLAAFEQALFGAAKPPLAVVTTPNIEYNPNYEGLAAGSLRHGDHRFEWTRAQFRQWGDNVAKAYGYRVRYNGIGDADAARGAPTQMGVFTLCE